MKNIPIFVRGKGFIPKQSRWAIHDLPDEMIVNLRLEHWGGGPGRRPPRSWKPKGIRHIAKLLGCNARTVSRRLNIIAEREEADA